jgi:hypothetical protein
MKVIRIAILILSTFLVIFSPAVDAGVKTSHQRSSSRTHYGGGRHTMSHGGYYAGSRNSHHKGGHYKNPRTNNHYGTHKP